MIAEVFHGMAFPCFFFEIIGYFLAGTAMIRAVGDVVVAGVGDIFECGFDAFFEGHKGNISEPQLEFRCKRNTV